LDNKTQILSESPALQSGVSLPAEPLYSSTPIAAAIHDETLWITLEGGRIIATPLAWYPRLMQATPDQRANIRLSPAGVHWPDVDEDLSVAGMLRGVDGTTSALEAVMTVREAAETYGVSRFTVHDAIRHGWLPAHKSGSTFLIRRRDAEHRWGGRRG
jgi:excisionase family DNA binding protein